LLDLDGRFQHPVRQQLIIEYSPLAAFPRREICEVGFPPT